MAECMKKLIKGDGSIVIEVQYLLNTLKDLTFDNIYHEHTNYWSLTALKMFFNNLDCKIFDVERINTHGGSLRIYVSKNPDVKIENSVSELIQIEKDFGLNNLKTYFKFGKEIENLKEKVVSNIQFLKSKYKSIVGYGAPAKSTTSLNFFKISSEIDYIIEDNELKVGKYVPGVNIEIKDKKVSKNINCILVLAWNFFKDIKKNNSALSKKFISVKDLEKEKLS